MHVYIIMYLYLSNVWIPFEFVLFEVHWASWMYRSRVLLKVGMFLTIFLQILSLPISVSSPSKSHSCLADVGMFDGFHRSKTVLTFLHPFSFLLWFFILSAQICFWAPLMNFFIMLIIYFSTLEFLLLFSCIFFLFTDSLYLLRQLIF